MGITHVPSYKTTVQAQPGSPGKQYATVLVGPQGPTGPVGPQGPQGVPGDLTRAVADGIYVQPPRVVYGGARTDLIQSTTGQLPGSVLSGLTLCAVDPNTAADVYGQKVGNSAQLSKATSGTGTVTDLHLFGGAGTGDYISGILILPTTGTILVTTTDSTNDQTATTVKRIWRSTDHGVTFTKVADLAAGGWLSQQGMYVRNGVIVAADYGIHTGDAATTRGHAAQFVYKSTDDGQTWTQILDVDTGAATSGRHVHAAFIDSNDAIWVSTGDGPGNRMVWKSINGGNSWTSSTIVDSEGTEKQVLGMEDHDGWIWAAIDDPNQGAIWRWRNTGPASAAEEVMSNGDSYSIAALTNSSGWQAPCYFIRRDPKFGAWYAYFPGETTGKRGRFMASGDGLLWQTLFETGDTFAPPSGRFEFDSAFVYFGNWRWPLLKPYVHRGIADSQVVPLTFNWSGTIADKTAWVTIRPDHLGFDFRVVRIAIALRQAGTQPVSVAIRNGASVITTPSSPTISANATGTGLQADQAIVSTPLQRFTALRSDALTLQVYAAGGGEDLTVVVLVEKYATPAKAKMSSTET